ncbi:MAG: hypothetical protein QOI29_3056 [Mycobacterium sp.]|jgi:hypothetical protein|nr:hypothetical protein [Mycobacterium sp.]
MKKPANVRLSNAEVTAELNASVDHAHLYAEYRRLAAEQAALRRLATLVGRGVEPPKVFDAVAREMRQCVCAEIACLWRYETAGDITLIAASYHSESLVKWPVGTRAPFAGDNLATVLQRTGRPARMDSYNDAGGDLAARIRAAGIRRAAGVPIMVDGRIWGLATVGSTHSRVLPADTVAHIGSFAELVATAVVAGYRDEQKRQILGGASRRPHVIDSLLQGQVLDEWSLWEVANCLRLPRNGPFVVLAADVSNRVTEALTDVEPKLRSIDVYSAWRLLPDVQVGILHVASDERFDKIVALVSRVGAERVGVSARFGDLRDTPEALHFAKVMMRSNTEGSSAVAIFDGSILATAAIGAPDLMLKSAGSALDRLAKLPAREREMLYETFRVWEESDASVDAVAAQLFCHPNTVRHRLRRIEKLTSRSLSRPRSVAELCLAFEVRRWLM